MSSISGISSSSAYSGNVSSVKRQRPDPAQMAEQAFSKLDTKGQGYLEVSDLESAFSNIASASGSSGTATSSSDATSTANDLFKKLDVNSDGKVTKDEFSSGLKKLADDLENQFNQSRTSGVGQDKGAPPPPPPSGASDTSGSTGAVSSSSATTSATATSSTSDASSTKTYEAADTNQDGKVTQKEEEAYLLKLLEAKAASGGNSGSTQQSSAADSNNSEATLFKKAIQLLQAYSSPSESNSQNISVSV